MPTPLEQAQARVQEMKTKAQARVQQIRSKGVLGGQGLLATPNLYQGGGILPEARKRVQEKVKVMRARWGMGRGRPEVPTSTGTPPPAAETPLPQEVTTLRGEPRLY